MIKYRLVLLSASGIMEINCASIKIYFNSRSERAGRDAYARYADLVSEGNVPFVRSSGGTRVVAAAYNWTHGQFHIH